MNFLFSISIILFYTPLLSGHIQHHPDLLTGVGGCVQSVSCYSNKQSYTYCNEHQQCECRFTYSTWLNESDNRKHCVKYKCTSKENNCALYWGSNVICDVSKTDECTCPTGLSYSQIDRKCIRLTKLGDKCDDNSICPTMSSCAGGECRCKVGNIRIDDYNCERNECDINEQCQKYQPNTICPTSFKGCTCADGYKLDHRDTECTRRLRQDDCAFGPDCGRGVVCQSNKCVCMQGYQENLKNNYECEPIRCSEDKDCTNRNDYSYCDTNNGQCKCSYSRSKDGSQCLKSPVLTPPAEKDQEKPQILYIVIYIATGSLLVFVLSFIAYRFYPRTQRLNDSLFREEPRL